MAGSEFFGFEQEREISIRGIKIYLRYADLEYFYPLSEAKPNEPKTTEVFELLLTDKSIVVDVGANIGWYTRPAAKKARIVYSFEPEPSNFSLLRKSVPEEWISQRTCSTNLAYWTTMEQRSCRY